MFKFRHKIIRNGNILTLFGVVILISISIFSFFNFTQKSITLTENVNKTQLTEIALQTSNIVDGKMSDLQNFVKCSAALFTDYEDLTSYEALLKLKLINEYGSFDRIRIVLPDKRSYDEEGNSVDVSDREYTKDAFLGVSGITGVLDSLYNSSKVIICYAPIYRDGKVQGVLTGIYETNSLSVATDMSSFGGNGFASIVEIDGDVIIAPKKDNLPEADQTNVWALFANADFDDGYSIEKLKTELEMGNSGLVEYTLGGEKRYTYYMPIQKNETAVESKWFVLQTVPETVITTHTDYINRLSVVLLIKVIGLFLIIFIFFWYYNSISRKSISHANQQLDSLINAVPGGVVKCIVNDGYKFLFVSDGFLNMVGYKLEQLIDKNNDNLLSCIHPEDKKSVENKLCTQKIDEITELKYRIIASSGKIIWVLNKCMHTIDKLEEKACLFCTCTDITDEKKFQQDLLISNERFKMAMLQTSNIVFDYDSATDKIHFVTKGNSYYQLPQVIEHGPFYFIENGIVCVEFAEHFINCFKEMSKAETSMVSLILKLRRADGKIVWNKLTISAINDPLSKSVHSIGTFEDIHQTKEAQMRQRREEKYRSAMLSDTITTYEVNLTDDQYIKITSKEKCNEYNNHNTYSASLIKLCDTMIYSDDKQLFMSIYNRENLINSYNTGRIILYNEYRHLDENAQPYWISCTTNLMSDPENGKIKAFSYIKNIDAQKKIELAIKHNSERDTLTDLYNRKAAINLITEYLSNPNTNTEKGAFLSIDLDRFKLINDKYGHITGDVLLNKVSICFRGVFDDSDIVARMGGDEFIVFMKNVGKRVDILSKALEACRAIKKLSVDSKFDICVTASIGIAMSPLHGNSFEELYKKSDKALYFAKETGKDRCVFYDPDME